MVMTRNPRPLPSLEYLNECFDLDRETGALYWEKRPREHFKDDFAHQAFCNQFTGKRADKLYSMGYHRVNLTIDGKRVSFGAHRIIFKMVFGHDPVPIVDHKDRNRANNIPNNLREATFSENIENRANDNSWRSRQGRCAYPVPSGKFVACVYARGRQVHLGTFDTEEEAASVAEEFKIAKKQA